MNTPTVAVITAAIVAASGMVMLATTAFVLRHLRRAERRARRQAIRLARLEMHEQHALWLHDDVCSRIRELRLRVGTEPGTTAIQLWLDSFEHGIRMKQLDELLSIGSVRVAEVAQPYLRWAMGRQVQLTRTPRPSVGSQRLDAADAAKLRHALAVLIGNAVEADATAIGVDVAVAASRLVVTVEDDAGGFVPRDEHLGRGLDSLRDEHGEDRLQITRTIAGSSVELIIERADDRREEKGTGGIGARMRASRGSKARRDHEGATPVEVGCGSS